MADIKNASNIGNALGLDNGSRTVNGKLVNVFNAACNISTPSITGGFAFALAAAPFKKFIFHTQLKGKGWRPVHTCLKVQRSEFIVEEFEGKNVIELPDYWRG